MKRMNLFYIGMMALAFMACTDDANEPVAGGEICLNASVGDIESRSVYLGETPNEDNPLKAWVWFSENQNEYGNNGGEPTYVPCRTVMEFDGSPVFAYNTDGKNLKYKATPTDNVYTPVYSVGFYPAEDVWSTTDGKTATATIDGTNDLMFASAIKGTWDVPFGRTEENKNLKFEHLLAWVKVCVCATSQEASATWGKIESISISSKKSISVDAGSGTVSYSEEGTVPVHTDVKNLHTTMQEIGEVFCSPATSYTITFKIGGKTVSKEIAITPVDGITLEKDEDAKGKLFILTLYFNEFDVVDAVCTLNAWDAQNEDLYMNSAQNQ